MTLDEREYGRAARRAPSDGVEAAPRSPLDDAPSAEHGRRAPEPFPRPLSSNGLRSQDGPLVARLHVSPRPQRRRVTGGRVTRFVADYGWRALVIPLLAVVTFLTMLDVTATETAPAAAEAAAPTTMTTVESSEAASDETVPPLAEAEGEGPAIVPTVEALVSYVEQGTGELNVVPGTSQVYGNGPLRRFVVELEGGINVDPTGFATAVELTLSDPRSWGADGRLSFQRVDGGDYDFRVALVSPGSMEKYCPGVGTGGYTSCRYGERVVINLARWETAVPDYNGDVATYRQYVINHEVGHALGNGHKSCPGPGQLAPVMQQQTLGLDGCLPNPWPYPDA